MGTIGGLLIVIAIAILAGGIAYVGDRVGHQVGRKRLTLPAFIMLFIYK